MPTAPSPSRASRLTRRALLLLSSISALLTACGEDLTCGAGTAEQRGVCVAAESDTAHAPAADTAEADTSPADATTADATTADATTADTSPTDAATTADTSTTDTATTADTSPTDTSATDTSTTDDGSDPLCDACELNAQRCDDRRVLSCAQLPNHCTTWIVSRDCNRFQSCEETTLTCVEVHVDPAGFDVPIPSPFGGPQVKSLLWDGADGLVTITNAVGETRMLTIVRFDASGVRATINPDINAQEALLFRAGGSVWMYWRDDAGVGAVSEVRADNTLGAPILTTANVIAQNLSVSPVGDAALLFQTSVHGGQAGYLGWFDPQQAEVKWWIDGPAFEWNFSTAAAAPLPDGGAVALWLAGDGTDVSIARFDAQGVRAPESGGCTDCMPDFSPVLGVLPRPDGFVGVIARYVEADDRFDLEQWVGFHDGRAPQRITTDRADTDFGTDAFIVGDLGSDILVGLHPSRDALVVARINPLGQIVEDPLVNTVGGGLAAFAGGTLANCWAVENFGARCAVRSDW